MAVRIAPPGSQTSLREANRARVIDSLRVHGHLTQVELAGVTGLSPATVSNIVKELSAAGVVSTRATARSGRRATEVRLARQPGLVGGVHVSSRHMRIAIADVAGTVLSEHNVPLAPDHRHDSELDRVALMLTDMLEDLESGFDDLQAVGIALPAPVDTVTGRVSAPGLLPGWAGTAVAEVLSSRIGQPVLVESEANVGALAVARNGLAAHTDPLVYIRVGHTISAGIVAGGRIFHGAGGRAGQLGHITIDERGPVCRCGSRGCLEAVAGGPALLARFRDDQGMHRVRDILLRADRGDAYSRRVIADAGRHVGVAVASLCNLVDPALIVVGGELAAADELFLAPLRHEVERSTLLSATTPEIMRTRLGSRAELLGCITLAIGRTPVNLSLLDIAG